MITKDNLKQLLAEIGFERNSNSLYEVLEKKYDETDVSVSVDFANEKIIYPSGIQADRDTTKNFSSNENFVVLECVCTLLKQGYKPEQIVLEPKTPGGREDSHFYCDILIRNNDKEPYLLVECKTAGEEFEDAWKKTLQDGGQLFRYYNSYRKAHYLCLYSSDFVDGKLKREYHLIKITDNEEQILADTDLLSYAKVSAANGSYEDFFHVWADTYEYDDMPRGAFEDSVPPFGISNRKLTANDDLRDVDNEEIKKKYNDFAVILRQHNVGSHENAFDKLVNLFLAKVVDETNNSDDLHFYWKGKSYDDDFSLQDRLQRLYRDGMKKFLHEDVTYIENNEIDKAFRWVQNDLDATKRKIKDYFRQLKFFSDNDFSFISVHNKRLFDQNAIILRKVVKMLQNIRLRTNEENQNQLLGDLFEGFLNKGVKQNEGQFFTPMPIVRFIVSALPLEQIIKDSPEAPYAIDYACGAGHFLTEYNFRIEDFVKKYHADIPLSEYHAHTIGIEKEYRLSKVTKVSAFMYGHDDTNVIYADALNHIDKVKDGTFSVLVANPPYAVSGFLETLSEKERKQYTLYNKDINLDKNNAIETFFMERAAQLLKTGGVAGIVLPISVLNKDGIYTRAREIVLKNFDIIALAMFGSGTFGKTGTNTVVMFLRRKETNTPESEHYHYRVECWFNTQHEADEVYKDADLLEAYCAHMKYKMEDYRQFLEGRIPDGMMQTEIVQNYYESFFGSQRNAMKGVCKEAKSIRAKFKQKVGSPTYKRKTEEERNDIANDAFYKFVKTIEKDKVYYFILAYKANCPIILMSMPSGKEGESATKEGQQFLGYKWSDTKGNEGIKYLHVKKVKSEEKDDGNAEDDDTIQQIRGIGGIITPLFNPNNLNDELKINSIIRNNFLGKTVNIPKEVAPFVCSTSLTSLLDFSQTAFNKGLSKKHNNNKSVETKWSLEKLGTIAEMKGGNTFSNEYQGNTNENDIPFFKVADMNIPENLQGMKVSRNYVNEKILLQEIKATVFEPNTIIFPKVGMTIHTNKKRILVRRAAIDNNVMALWVRNEKSVLPKYLLEYFNSYIQLSDIASDSNPPSISAQNLEKVLIPLPPLDVQQKIVDECATIDRQQGEYTHLIELGLQDMRSLISSLTGEKKKVIKVCNINATTITPSEHPTKEYIYIDIDAVKNGTGEISWNKIIKGNDAPSRARRYAESGSTLISTVRPNLRGFAFVEEENKDALYSTGFAILKSKDQSVIADKMIYYQFMFSDLMMQQMVAAMPQGSYPSINRGDIESFDIIVSISSQDEVLRNLNEIEERVKTANEKLAEVPNLKQAILDKYLK